MGHPGHQRPGLRRPGPAQHRPDGDRPRRPGRLLDRNGTVLVQDQVTWQAQVDQEADPAVRQRLAALCREEGVAWSGTGPVEEVTPRLLARVKEEGLSGVTFTPVAQRVGQGTLAPHVLGRVGQMSPEEWETYGAQGYTMDALVGKDGAEAAFESYSTAPPASGWWRLTRPAGSPPPPMPRNPRRGGTSPSPWTGTCRPRRRRPWLPSWTATPVHAGPWWPWT
ncbi:MAG: hypothetical protein ACLR6W_08415 [Evtepia sp.]